MVVSQQIAGSLVEHAASSTEFENMIARDMMAAETDFEQMRSMNRAMRLARSTDEVEKLYDQVKAEGASALKHIDTAVGNATHAHLPHPRTPTSKPNHRRADAAPLAGRR